MEITQLMMSAIIFGVAIIGLVLILVFSRWPKIKDKDD